ncbi:MAG: HNH endonuclease [Actinomycetia bacterium]|nr:HNH endonuclease [Actinomycetes bacterium]
MSVQHPAAQRAIELHHDLLDALADKRRADARCAALLAQISDQRLYRLLGFARLHDYAEQALQLTARKTTDLLRIARQLADLPVLREAFEAGSLPWTKVREVLRVATPDNEGAWAAMATGSTSRQLEQMVTRTQWGELPPAEPEPVREPARRRVVVVMEAADVLLLEQALALLQVQTGLPAGELDRGAALGLLAQRFLADAAEEGGEHAPHRERYQKVIHADSVTGEARGEAHEVSEREVDMADCDAEIVDLRPGPTLGHRRRTIPPALRRAVLLRDERRCVVPGCGCTLWLDVHHRRAVAYGGGNDLDNLETLCCIHHGMVHDGELSLERRPDGGVVARYRTGRCDEAPPTPLARSLARG